MNCQEVQLQLSGYLEKSLDAIRMKSIETHLVSCPFCRAETHGLADCIRQIADLPILEPPAGFAQRVMAHAREIEIEPRRWQWLLSAFKSTVPIQAAAVVLVAVLAVLLYQKNPRFEDPSVAELSAPRTPVQAERKTSRGAENAPIPAVAPTRSQDDQREIRTPSESTPQPAARAPRQVPANALAKNEAPESPSIPSTQSEKSSVARVDAPRRAPIQAQEVSTGRESSRPRADTLGLGALNRQLFRGGPSSTERALSPLSEPSADFEFIVRRRPPQFAQREGASGDALHKRSEADAAIAAAAAQQAVPAPASPASAIVEIRWFTVAPHHLQQFRQELAAEAAIDSEKAAAPAEREFALKSARELLIKVTILPSER